VQQGPCGFALAQGAHQLALATVQTTVGCAYSLTDDDVPMMQKKLEQAVGEGRRPAKREAVRHTDSDEHTL
jgi:hypothetical protein